VDGGREPHPPLTITLTGACVVAAPNPTSVEFQTPVRASVTQMITLSNPSPSLWRIRPVLQPKHFTGAEVVEVVPGKQTSYTVSYSPLTMTGSGERHEVWDTVQSCYSLPVFARTHVCVCVRVRVSRVWMYVFCVVHRVCICMCVSGCARLGGCGSWSADMTTWEVYGSQPLASQNCLISSCHGLVDMCCISSL
jgi:hypothetical protein